MVDLRLIHSLEQCVTGGRCQFMRYKEFGLRFGFGPRGPGKKRLDPVAKAFKKDPKIGVDLTYLLSNTRYDYPSQIDGKLAKPPSPRQKAKARAEAQKIIDKYCPGTRNPYRSPWP